MNKNYKKAYEELKAAGVPVFINPDNSESFCVDGENYGKDGTLYADFYSVGFNAKEMGLNDHDGVHPKVTAILDKYNLYCEWKNAGSLSVWDN